MTSHPPAPGGRLKADRDLIWQQPHEGHFHAIRDDRSEFRVHALSGGDGYRAERVDDGLFHNELARACTLDEAKQICQDLRTREIRRAAWMAYMDSHDPPEE
jgi:hypothetical protein